MSTTTEPIPLFGLTDAMPGSNQLPDLLWYGRCRYALDLDPDTHPVFIDDVQGRQRRSGCRPAGRFYSVRAAAVAALVALRRAMANDELSRPLELPDLKTVAFIPYLGHFAMPFQCQTVSPSVVVERGQDGESTEEVEPTIAFHWSKTRRKVRTAARKYGEQTHADY